MIGIDERDGLLTVTLQRPEKANSLTKAMLEDLEPAYGLYLLNI